MARGKRQEARVKRVWAILRFFTQFGFIVFTYLRHAMPDAFGTLRERYQDLRMNRFHMIV